MLCSKPHHSACINFCFLDSQIRMACKSVSKQFDAMIHMGWVYHSMTMVIVHMASTPTYLYRSILLMGVVKSPPLMPNVFLGRSALEKAFLHCLIRGTHQAVQLMEGGKYRSFRCKFRMNKEATAGREEIMPCLDLLRCWSSDERFIALESLWELSNCETCRQNLIIRKRGLTPTGNRSSRNVVHRAFSKKVGKTK